MSKVFITYQPLQVIKGELFILFPILYISLDNVIIIGYVLLIKIKLWLDHQLFQLNSIYIYIYIDR